MEVKTMFRRVIEYTAVNLLFGITFYAGAVIGWYGNMLLGNKKEDKVEDNLEYRVDD